MKKNLDSIIKKHLKSITESVSGEMEHENYMFFGNIEQMKRQCELLMNEDHNTIDDILKEHDWAQDHIAEAKSLLDQVFDFLMNQTKGGQTEKEVKPNLNQFSLNEDQIDEAKHEPTNKELWSKAKSMAKSKFKVYPSAYANGWASKWYKEHGGGWRTKKKLNENSKDKSYEIYHNTYTSAINDALEYAEKKGYEYSKDEAATKIGMGPRKPDEGKTNRITITLFKDGKEQKKALHIQVYGMKEKYELNCYIN